MTNSLQFELLNTIFFYIDTHYLCSFPLSHLRASKPRLIYDTNTINSPNAFLIDKRFNKMLSDQMGWMQNKCHKIC